MSLADQGLTEWVVSKLSSLTDSDLEACAVQSPGFISIERQVNPPFVAALMTSQRVVAADIGDAIALRPDIEFLTVIPRASIIDGSAWDAAKTASVGLGRLGDLMRSTNARDVRSYVNPETRFVERGLTQHSAVSRFSRVDDVRYDIVGRSGSAMAAMVNAYELTADVIRTAWDRYGAFDILVLTNPNARETVSSVQVRSGLDIEVLKWGPFLARLNSLGMRRP